LWAEADAALIVEAVNQYDSLKRKAEALDALIEAVEKWVDSKNANTGDWDNLVTALEWAKEAARDGNA
jgi:hypothetical protein